MTMVAGIDGIKGGWVVVLKRRSAVDVRRAATFGQALDLCEGAAVVGVDMPIGLPAAAAAGGRACDREARKAVGPKKTSCIFSPPCRQALQARSFLQANQINRASSRASIGLSQQSFAIFGKLREVDGELTPLLQGRVREIHPEVSFAYMRDVVAPDRDDLKFLTPKKRSSGRRQRGELLRLAGFADPASMIAAGRVLGAAPDDTLDACAAAWTADRILEGSHGTLPHTPLTDARGLRMEICW